jgi:type IV secretory pathway VirB2 component (pilin)
MRINIYQKICVGFLGVLILFWAVLYDSHSTSGFYNYLYSFLFGLIPLIGGLVALIDSRIWGGLKSAIGKAVLFIGLGLFLWGSGETIWSYYNFFLNEAAPYPSIADLGFAPSVFFYGLGAIYLAKATGAKYGLRNGKNKIFVALATIVSLAIAYYVIVVLARGGVVIPQDETPLKAILDVAYPVGDLVSMIVAVIVSGLSFQYFGGRYKADIIYILIGLFVMFIADSIFSYATTAGTFYNGEPGDLVLTFGLFFITFGVLGFCEKPKILDTKVH